MPNAQQKHELAKRLAASLSRASESRLVESRAKIKESYSVVELVDVLAEAGVDVSLTKDEKDFLDSIYLPSKHSAESMLADGESNQALSERYTAIVERIIQSVYGIV